MKIFSTHEGQTLVEVLVAIAIVTLVLVAIVSRSVEAVRNANYARNQVLATRFAQEGIEWARRERDRMSWANYTAALDAADVTYCVPDVLTGDIEVLTGGACNNGTPADFIAGTIFLRDVRFQLQTPASGEFVEVAVSVTWEDSIGPHAAQLHTNLSEWSDL